MKKLTPHQFSLLLMLLVGISLPGWTMAGGASQKLCIFGDSLSDSGNFFEIAQEVSTRPYELVPSAPYPIGGITFSNGPTWIQQLAKSLGRNNDAKPAFRGSGAFCNYSFGSARARQRPSESFDLPDLVSLYLEDVQGNADPDTLYVMFVGGNDIRDALVAFASDPNVSLNILNDAVTAIIQSTKDLADAGAVKFLIMNGPNVGLVPAVRMQGLQAQLLATFLSSQFNTALADNLLLLPPGIEIVSFDVFAFASGLPDLPPSGVENVTDSCITPGVRNHAICAHPNQYLFWDGIHPTRVVHAALAQAVAEEFPSMLSAVTPSGRIRLAQMGQ